MARYIAGFRGEARKYGRLSGSSTLVWQGALAHGVAQTKISKTTPCKVAGVMMGFLQQNIRTALQIHESNGL
jgi:hypothetical protein